MLAGAWLLVDPRSPDLAAQSYRETLFARYGFTLWDDNWYGGHHLPGYSLVFPWLALALGMRVLGAMAVLVSTVAFERIVVPIYGPRARWGAACFAIAAAGDLWIGRLTFALGVSFAMLAVLAPVRRGRGWRPRSPRCARRRVPSPGCCWRWPRAAGPSLRHGLDGAGEQDARGLPRHAAGASLVTRVGAGGAGPACRAAARGPVPRGRLGAFCAQLDSRHAGGDARVPLRAPARGAHATHRRFRVPVRVLVSIVPTPMGSNIDRYAVLLAGPLLVCALGRDGLRARRQAAGIHARGRGRGS